MTDIGTPFATRWKYAPGVAGGAPESAAGTDVPATAAPGVLAQPALRRRWHAVTHLGMTDAVRVQPGEEATRVAHAAHAGTGRPPQRQQRVAALEQFGIAVEAAAGDPAVGGVARSQVGERLQQPPRIDAQRAGCADRAPLRGGTARVGIAEEIERHHLVAVPRGGLRQQAREIAATASRVTAAARR